MKKVILAFSGGLDTSFCALYLKAQGYNVVTLTVDTGGFTKQDKEVIKKQAKKVGSIKHIFINAKQDLFDAFAAYIIKGNVLRGGVYPLCVGPERIIIAKKLAELAILEKADAVAHGSTGAGNDQVRFDIALSVLLPGTKVITPIRDLGITRSKEIEFLKKNNIQMSEAIKLYSINKGLLGTTIGGSETNGSWDPLPDSAYPTVLSIDKTPNQGEEIIISFKKGLPVQINGKRMHVVAIMEFLNLLGAKHGVGKAIHLGNTVLGIKGRVGFEAPGALILIKAHTELEKLVLTKWQLFWKETICNAYGNFLHEALYFDPVVKDIEAFIDNSQTIVTGQVKVKLIKGNICIQGVKSSYSLMSSKIATYGEENLLWNGQDAKGFSKIYGLQSILVNRAKKIGKKYER